MKLIYTGDFERLKEFGFEEYNKEFSRKYKNDIITTIDKQTREIEDIDTEYKFLQMKNLGSSKRCNDLIQAGLVKKEEE